MRPILLVQLLLWHDGSCRTKKDLQYQRRRGASLLDDIWFTSALIAETLAEHHRE